MNGVFSWEAFYRLPIIGILRGMSPAFLIPAVEAAWRGGLTTVEVSMSAPDAIESFVALREALGDRMNVGVGTVCTVEMLDRVLEAGAEFVVTPAMVPDVITRCVAANIPVFPGAFTPTEVLTAWNLGASMVKVFPAGALGPAFIRDMQGPFPNIPLLPTGGVTLDTIADFRRAGAAGYGIGGALFVGERIREGAWEWLEAHMQRYANLITDQA